MNSHDHITARSYIPRYRFNYQVGTGMGMCVAAALTAVGVVTAGKAVVKRLSRVVRYAGPAGGSSAAVPEKYEMRCLCVYRLGYGKWKYRQDGN
jgi:hypothetical protein